MGWTTKNVLLQAGRCLKKNVLLQAGQAGRCHRSPERIGRSRAGGLAWVWDGNMDGATGFGAVGVAKGAGSADGAVALCNAVYEGLVQGGAGAAAGTLAMHVRRRVQALLDDGAGGQARWASERDVLEDQVLDLEVLVGALNAKLTAAAGRRARYARRAGCPLPGIGVPG